MSQKYSHNDVFINALGGSDVIIDVLQKQSILKFIDKKLGKRSARAEYSYGEGILMWFTSICRGARRIENVYNHKYEFIKHPRFNKFLSPDSLLYMFKELAVENEYFSKQTKKNSDKNKSKDKQNELNDNKKLNDLLISMAIKLGLLKEGVGYTLDYDTTILNTKIHGSRVHYLGQGKTGYNPAVAMINNIPVYLENRNGDSSPKFLLVETITKILDLLGQKGITIKTVRVDGVAYSKDFTDEMNRRNLTFFTRVRTDSINSIAGEIGNWKNREYNIWKAEIGDTTIKFGKYETRIIAEEKESSDEKRLYGIMTNDMNMTNEDALTFYAKRGNAENLFKNMKGDFCWSVMAMRNFKNNTVFLLIQALCYQLFTFIKRLFAGVLKFVRRNMTLKTFISVFMGVVTYWNNDELVFMTKKDDYVGLAGFT